MKQFIFIFLTCLFLSSCGDKNCDCIGSESLEKIGESCRCNSKNFQLGTFVTECSEIQKPRGKCILKKKNSYLMIHDCVCSSLTLVDSLVVTFGESDISFYVENLYNLGFSVGSVEGNYFLEKSDGNEFRYEFSSKIKSGDSLFAYRSCEGTAPSYIGVFKGKFNSDNTFCKAKIYWQISDSEILDSCDVMLIK